MVHTDHGGKQYREDLDLAHASFDGYTSVAGMQTDGKVDARCIDVAGNLSWTNSRVAGRMYAWNLTADNLNLSRSEFGDDIYLRSSTVPYNTTIRDTTVQGEADVSRAQLGCAFLQETAIAEGVSYRDTEFDGTLFLNDLETPLIDLRGVTLPKLYVDELERYDFRVDDDTWIGEVAETGSETRDITDDGEELLERIVDRPRFPIHERDGCTFTYDDLKQDLVMSYHQPFFANLVKQGAIHRVDDDHYLVRTDVL